MCRCRWYLARTLQNCAIMLPKKELIGARHLTTSLHLCSLARVRGAQFGSVRLMKSNCVTTRLIRWRSAYRSCLIDNISYVRVSHQLQIRDFGIPRLSDGDLGKFLAITANSKAAQLRARGNDPTPAFRLGYSTVARNFLSTYLEPPPVLGIDGTSLEAAPGSSIALMSEDMTFAALASTAGDACFWYWLTRADGFHVTNWLLNDFLTPLDSFPEENLKLLREAGKLLHRHRFSDLSVQKERR